MGTGAFAGMTMANNLNTAVTQMTGKDIEGHVSGWFAKQPQTTMTQGGYLPQLNGPITPPVPANRYLPAGRMTANGYLPQLTGYTDYMGMNSASAKGIGSDSPLGKSLLQF
jgi:hypothetical protein